MLMSFIPNRLTETAWTPIPWWMEKHEAVFIMSVPGNAAVRSRLQTHAAKRMTLKEQHAESKSQTLHSP